MEWVRVVNNIVIEIVPQSATTPPALLPSIANGLPSITYWYGEDFAAQCVQAPDNVEQGWVHDPDSGTFAPPTEPELLPPEPDPFEEWQRDVKSAIINLERAALRDGQITIDDIPVRWRDEVNNGINL